MSPILPLGVALRAWQSSASLLFRSAIWLPFLLMAGIQALALGLLLGFHHDLLLPVGAPLVEMLAGREAMHYPVLYLALPMMFAKVNLGINVLVASLASGVATVLFARAFGSANVGSAWRAAFRSWPVLIVLAALSIALVLGVSYLTSLVPEETRSGSRGVRWGVRALSLLLFVLVQSMLAYTTAWVVLRGQSIWPALRDSVRVAFRTFLPTFIVVGIPALLLYPFSYAVGRVEWIASKFRPEMVSALIGVQLFFELVATFVVVGAITRLFLWRMGAAR